MSTTEYDTVYGLSMTDEECRHILDVLDNRECQPEVASRRRSERSSLRGMTTLVIEDWGRVAYQVLLRNVSEHGMAFIMSTPLPSAIGITVLVPKEGTSERVARRGFVVRCAQVATDAYEIGMSFGISSM